VINGALVEPNRDRARVEGGVIIRKPNGPAMRAAVSYDGIGDSDFDAVSGKLWLNFPLN
jgi:hypothetical protein